MFKVGKLYKINHKITTDEELLWNYEPNQYFLCFSYYEELQVYKFLVANEEEGNLYFGHSSYFEDFIEIC
jgi:hypothetical protein